MEVRGRTRPIADGALALALTASALSVIAGAASPLSLDELLDGFVVSSTIIGLTLVAAGYPIARLRPGNTVGWLLLGGGLAYLTSGAGYAVLAWGAYPIETNLGWRVVADLTSIGWPLAVGFFIPMTFLFFPDGHLPGRRWRVIVVAAAIGALGFTASMTLGSEDTTGALDVNGYLRWPAIDGMNWLGPVSAALVLATYLAAFVSLVVRYRRGGDESRRQILWVALAALMILTVFVVDSVLNLESWFGIFVIMFLPIAILIAILRYQLVDIQLVMSRSVLYLLMTGLVIGAYVVIVTLVDRTLSPRVSFGPPVLAALAIALAFNPIRQALQARIDRLFYGDRRDPARAAVKMSRTLGEVGVADSSALTELLATICEVLRVPWATISVAGDVIARVGEAEGNRHSLELSLGDQVVGELSVGMRRGENELNSSDAQILELLAGSVAVAVRSTQYADELRGARRELITAREEERRRVHQDLHDGLGPQLTGVILTADAARRLVHTNPDEAESLISDVRQQATDAIDEVRRLARGLRPPALDGLGLVDALDEYSTTLRPLQVSVTGPERMPALPSAVEVATYCIATEALTNAVRHSTASAASVELTVDPSALTLVVHDNGDTSGEPWDSGVGLQSMSERASELGGSFRAGPTPSGGVVAATIPCRGAT